ncbi:hypothetical protein KIN20_028698 [Parelaphostrongylus tenuis]|uniref:Uncharacterized protein n=1 Tax=Parelaphostrongylus tenuis TaxID=148309 RepID=A0AAD5R1Z1_PARTN|nr:hypothetical protein KIN20_028698 [Parelaphostrongylus tenuis]
MGGFCDMAEFDTMSTRRARKMLRYGKNSKSDVRGKDSNHLDYPSRPLQIH